jgi:hypothetical protein
MIRRLLAFSANRLLGMKTQSPDVIPTNTMTDPFTISFEQVDQWDEMLKTQGHCATFWEIAKWGYEQHEKVLLDAMHAVVPQPYEPED